MLLGQPMSLVVASSEVHPHEDLIKSLCVYQRFCNNLSSLHYEDNNASFPSGRTYTNIKEAQCKHLLKLPDPHSIPRPHPADKTTWSRFTSPYLSVHRARHCCSLLLRDEEGLVMHFSKHLSLIVCSYILLLRCGVSLQSTFRHRDMLFGLTV